MSYEEIRSSRPKARKNYSCEWCGEKILKGEVHLSRAYKFDGDFIDGRMHLECEKAMYKLRPSDAAEGFITGSMPRWDCE